MRIAKVKSMDGFEKIIHFVGLFVILAIFSYYKHLRKKNHTDLMDSNDDDDDYFTYQTKEDISSDSSNNLPSFKMRDSQINYTPKTISKILSGNVFFISQFDGGWNDPWPTPIIALLSNGKIRTDDDIFYFRSNNKIAREIRGGSTMVPITADNSIEGPIDGYDDGELSGRMLSAAGYSNFWFYEIDFSGIDKSIDEWLYIILDPYNRSGNTQDIMPLRSFNINVIKIPQFSQIKDFSRFLSEMRSKINDEEHCLLSDYIPFENHFKCLLVGRFIRVNSTEWRYEPKWESIDIEEYLSNLSYKKGN